MGLLPGGSAFKRPMIPNYRHHGVRVPSGTTQTAARLVLRARVSALPWGTRLVEGIRAQTRQITMLSLRLLLRHLTTMVQGLVVFLRHLRQPGAKGPHAPNPTPAQQRSDDEEDGATSGPAVPTALPPLNPSVVSEQLRPLHATLIDAAKPLDAKWRDLQGLASGAADSLFRLARHTAAVTADLEGKGLAGAPQAQQWALDAASDMAQKERQLYDQVFAQVLGELERRDSARGARRWGMLAEG